ncbi:hypothetical protein RI367_007332 [Sorochytrium milnesiophthora]
MSSTDAGSCSSLSPLAWVPLPLELSPSGSSSVKLHARLLVDTDPPKYTLTITDFVHVASDVVGTQAELMARKQECMPFIDMTAQDVVQTVHASIQRLVVVVAPSTSSSIGQPSFEAHPASTRSLDGQDTAELPSTLTMRAAITSSLWFTWTFHFKPHSCPQHALRDTVICPLLMAVEVLERCVHKLTDTLKQRDAEVEYMANLTNTRKAASWTPSTRTAATNALLQNLVTLVSQASTATPTDLFSQGGGFSQQLFSSQTQTQPERVLSLSQPQTKSVWQRDFMTTHFSRLIDAASTIAPQEEAVYVEPPPVRPLLPPPHIPRLLHISPRKDPSDVGSAPSSPIQKKRQAFDLPSGTSDPLTGDGDAAQSVRPIILPTTPAASDAKPQPGRSSPARPLILGDVDGDADGAQQQQPVSRKRAQIQAQLAKATTVKAKKKRLF